MSGRLWGTCQLTRRAHTLDLKHTSVVSQGNHVDPSSKVPFRKPLQARCRVIESVVQCWLGSQCQAWIPLCKYECKPAQAEPQMLGTTELPPTDCKETSVHQLASTNECRSCVMIHLAHVKTLLCIPVCSQTKTPRVQVEGRCWSLPRAMLLRCSSWCVCLWQCWCEVQRRSL